MVAISEEARVKSSKDDRNTALEAMLMRVGTDEFNMIRLFLSIASLRQIPRVLFSRLHEIWCALKSPNISDRDVRSSRKVRSRTWQEGGMYTLHTFSPITVMHRISNSSGHSILCAYLCNESRTKMQHLRSTGSYLF